MKKPNDVDRLHHILDAIAKIERYLQNFDLQKFRSDDLTIDAVVRNIEIIGEATTCLDRGLRRNIRISNGVLQRQHEIV